MNVHAVPQPRVMVCYVIIWSPDLWVPGQLLHQKQPVQSQNCCTIYQHWTKLCKSPFLNHLKCFCVIKMKYQQYCAMPTCTYVAFAFPCTNYYTTCCYMQGLAQNADNKRRVHLAIWTYNWNFVNSNGTSFAAPNPDWTVRTVTQCDRAHLENARNWKTSRLPCRGSVSSRWGSKGTGSVGSRTSATSPLWSTMSGKPAEWRWAIELLELTGQELEGKGWN